MNLSLLALVCAMLAPVHAKAQEQPERNIIKVETVEVDCPVGTAPRLPFQVWVTYSDGFSEYRQTRWSNSALASEKNEADPTEYAVGADYTVGGFIIGDNTTSDGYPIKARVKVVRGKYNTPSHVTAAHTFPLSDVSVTGDNRLTHNRDLDIATILSWDVSQQLYNYRDTYGLSTEGYKDADGWDSPTTKLKGHGTGHYLSALAFAFASATDPAQKAQLRANIKRMVDEMRLCQERTFVWSDSLGRYWEARDFAPEEELRQFKGTWADFDNYKKEWTKYGYGYMNAIPAQHPVMVEMYRPYNNSDWVWAPYYTIHKQLAGLIDIATYIDDKAVADKALLIAKDMGLWVWNRFHYRTFVSSEGSQDERRAKPGNRYEMWNIYIAGENGGMGESMARLAEMVSDPEEKAKLIEGASYFDNPVFFGALSQNVDDIRTRHANQHIPQIVGALRSYLTNDNPYYYNVALNFWNMIQGRYRYSTGGVGNGEMFRQPYTQILSMVTNGVSGHDTEANPDLNETCCAYNMAKLTKDLNCFDPDNASYMDYYERVLYNQIVGSLNPDEYSCTYQYAVGLNATKPFGNETPQSTCCGGTGSENHVKYQEATYFASDNTLWVALYMPTVLNWRAKGVTVTQDCLWPAEKSTITVKGGATFALKLRVPYWATAGFDVKLNGQSIATNYHPSSYVEIPARRWSDSDVVEVIMPFSKHIDFGPDKLENQIGKNGKTIAPSWVGTLMYGPLAMTGTDVDNWTDASLNVDSFLTTVKANGHSEPETGYMGNVYSLTCNGKTFLPDYYRNENSTHYYRINLLLDPSAELKDIVREKIDEVSAYRKANYTGKTFKGLAKATAAATAALTEAKLTQARTDAMIAGMDKAVAGLKAKKLDKNLLGVVLANANAKDAKLYTWDSYDAMKAAAAAAAEVLASSKDQTAIDLMTKKMADAQKALVSVEDIDKAKLAESMNLVNQRVADQNRWNAMTVKVPEYAPWAPHGFRRMTDALAEAKDVFENASKNYNQKEVDETTARLNSAINAMRPGNLAEPEDLEPLFDLMWQVGQKRNEPKAREVMDYIRMVVRYVQDGSGTQDMIDKALAQAKEVMGHK